MLAVDSGVDPKECEKAEAYFTEDGEPCLSYFYDSDPVRNRVDGRPVHVVHVQGDPERGQLIGYVELFGCVRIIVCLANQDKCCLHSSYVKCGFCMPGRKRQGNDPKRRVSPLGTLSCDVRANLANARYVGNALHKSKPGDYCFTPPANPRHNKSLCDDLRPIRKREAIRLFRSGIRLDMVSTFVQNGLPKYVWAVDHDGQAYEAKLGDDGSAYHGYRLYKNDPMQAYVLATWQGRNQ